MHYPNKVLSHNSLGIDMEYDCHMFLKYLVCPMKNLVFQMKNLVFR